jgi:diguanylate cyclase (GGDEF)-like protein
MPPLPTPQGAENFVPLQAMRVLLVEDTAMDARLIQENLRSSSWGKRITLNHVTSLAAAAAALQQDKYDCVLLDLGLPDGRGVQNVSVLRGISPETTIVVITGLDDEQTAVAALKLGAQEYAVKGMPAGELLVRLLRHAIERHHMLDELNKLREQEYFQATHDILTGLPNRQLFADRASQMVEQARRQQAQIAVCYVDLDGFKPVNDSYGHAVGDMLLKTVAEELRQAIRASDTAARLGGDEFAVLMAPSQSGRLEAQQIAQRIIDRIQAIATVAGHPVRIGASIGIAILPDHAEDLEQLLHHADLAMYAAKQGGRGCYRFYSAEMHGERDQKSRLLAEIGESLRQGHFFLHWQPWLDLQQQVVAGVEALPRWHVQGGDVRHLRQFRAAVAEGGLSTKIMQQVLPQACRQWVQWRRQGLNVGFLAYEMSFRDLRDTQAVNDLGRILLEHGVPAEKFQINLPGDTDTLQRGGQVLVQRVAELRGIGFRVLLDQFVGDGPALGMMSEMHASAVRIDGEMVGRLDGPLREETLPRIARILDTASSFGIEVVVPDVENRAQLQLLRQLGCRYMQGFLLARPGDARHTEHLLRETVKL